MNSQEPPPKNGPHLESSPPGAYPGGLVKNSLDPNNGLPPPTQALPLGNRDALRPPVRLIGDWDIESLNHVGGRTITPEGELLYVLDIYPTTGRANRHVCRPHHVNHTLGIQLPTTIDNRSFSETDDNDRGRRSRRDFIHLVEYNRLTLFISLDYQDRLDSQRINPEWCNYRFELFLRRLRHSGKTFRWIEVLEYGRKTHRLGHHAFLSPNISKDEVQDAWHDGLAVCKQIRSMKSLRKAALYTSKEFLKPEDMRPRERRYRPGRGLLRETPIRLIGTLEEIEAEFDHITGTKRNLTQWQSDHPFSRGGYTWDVPI